MSYHQYCGLSHVLDRGTVWILITIIWLFPVPGFTDTTDSFRSLFVRHSNKRLSAINTKYVTNTTVDTCTDRCIREIEFQCKSFDYDNTQKACLLFTVSLDDRDVHLIDSTGKDHFETAYTRLFSRLPTHRLPVDVNRQVTGVSAEACARYCIMEAYFKCRGFNYRSEDELCMLLENNPVTSTGAIYSENVDYYEKNPEGPMAKFINFGMGRMRPLTTGPVHQKGLRGKTLDQCAQLCVDETTFECASFDFLFEGVDSACYLSQYIAANVGGLVIDAGPNVQHNHYEKIGERVAYFYATPYGIIPENNLKTYTHVTPDRCARYCMEEDSFVCRSFDYRIADAACMLSDLAGSDVGGLTTRGGYQGDVHHFEMKPILDCGGNLTAEEGNIASPNWPRDYSHHELCEWYISTTQFKVLHLTFTHFDMGHISSDPCNEQNDRLTITESKQPSYCVLANTKTIHTKSNQIKVSFQSNGHVDAQGFRMFYSADWTCNENLNKSAEIASPKWPKAYPSGSRCSWKLTAPANHRVLLRFSNFELEHHVLGHCNERLDHVKVLDGGTVNSPLVGLYCGTLSPFVVRSSGLDMFVQFVSDNDIDNTRKGFHANFVFEPRNDSYFDRGGFAGPGYTNVIKNDDSADNKASGQISEGEGENGWISLEEHHEYKTTMWAIITFLMLLLVAASVGLFLLHRYHRGRYRREHEIIEEDGVVMPLVAMPTTNLCNVKPNNDADAVAVVPNSCQAIALPPDGDTGAVAGPSEDMKINNLDLCSKYAKDNEKNINVDKKNLDLQDDE